MIEYIQVTNEAGDTLQLPLSDYSQTGMAVISVEGIGTVRATINMTSYSDSDLKKKNYSSLEARNIIINLRFFAVQDLSVEDVRDRAYVLFTPQKKVHFVIKTDRRFVGTDGYVESNEPTIFSKEESTQISILCEDPILYDEEGGFIDRSDNDFNAMESLFEFPFMNDSLTERLIILGEIRHKPINAITYEGEYDIGLTITMHCKGVVVDPIIYSNRQHGEFLLMTDKLPDVLPDSPAKFLKGDIVTITTVPGSKSITLLRDGKAYNILHILKAGSTWPMLKNGANEFVIDAGIGFELISISYKYSLGYLGV